MISVIVPTYNREECLYKMLESLDKQKHIDFEVIVIDQSEIVTDQKIEKILNSCKHLQYYHINKRGRSLSKNFAIDKAKGDILLFCDDDIVVDEYFLAEHVKVHMDYPEVGALSCHLIEPHEKEIQCNMPLKITTYGRFINKPNSNYNGFVTSLNGGNMSFKKEALRKVGYFEENLRGTSMLEEPDIAYRVLSSGYKIYFSSNNKVKHFPQYNGNLSIRKGKKYQWQNDYFFNQFYFMFRNKRTKYLPFIFIYLTYRTLVEIVKNKIVSIKFLFLPLSSLQMAYVSWCQKKNYYRIPWYTSKKNAVGVLKCISNFNEYAFK